VKVCEDLRGGGAHFLWGTSERRAFYDKVHQRFSAAPLSSKLAPETRLDIKCTGLIVDELHLCRRRREALVMWKGVAVICTGFFMGGTARWMDRKGLVQTRGVDWILTCVL
jgi:hypothetical protein